MTRTVSRENGTRACSHCIPLVEYLTIRSVNQPYLSCIGGYRGKYSGRETRIKPIIGEEGRGKYPSADELSSKLLNTDIVTKCNPQIVIHVTATAFLLNSHPNGDQ
jgi:hypothetical protein